MGRKKVFGIGLDYLMTTIYTKDLVGFLAQFMYDAQTLMEVEKRFKDIQPPLKENDIGLLKVALEEALGPKSLHQPDKRYLQDDGFGIYLFEIMTHGVAHPVVRQRIRENFGDFGIVSSICEKIEKIIKERLPDRFSDMEEVLKENELRDVEYLRRYYPLR